MKRSTAALTIAILVHLIIALAFWIFGMFASKIEHKPADEEVRIKVSLKDPPKKPVKNKTDTDKKPLHQIIPPMPKGSQLKQIVKDPLIVPRETKAVEKPKPVVQQPVPLRKQPETVQKKTSPVQPLPQSRKHIVVSKDKNISKPADKIEVKKSVPKEHSKLYALLSKPSSTPAPKTVEERSTKRESLIGEDVKEAYGDLFGTLSAAEQKYILDNQEIMRRITQETLNRVGSVNVPGNLRVNTMNIVEFYLHPNGDISDLKIVKNSGFYILDDTTKETIEYAYSRYPKPEQKTLVRYKVGYYLRGY